MPRKTWGLFAYESLGRDSSSNFGHAGHEPSGSGEVMLNKEDDEDEAAERAPARNWNDYFEAGSWYDSFATTIDLPYFY